MRKTCDVCERELGFRKFKYKEGMICKHCYEKASRNYTETIAQKTKSEILALCKVKEVAKENWSAFERTRKIGNYILFDDKHGSFCITHNRMNEKDMPKAEIIHFEDLKKVELYCEPDASRETLSEWLKTGRDTVVKSLEIRVWSSREVGMKRIILLSTPVRAKSFAFRKVFGFAERILDALNQILEEKEAKIA